MLAIPHQSTLFSGAASADLQVGHHFIGLSRRQDTILPGHQLSCLQACTILSWLLLFIHGSFSGIRAWPGPVPSQSM